MSDQDLDCIIINLDESSEYSTSSEEEIQMELIYDGYSIDQDDREDVLLPKCNVKNMFTSKQPSITDIFCRKRQVKLFKRRDQCGALAWQYHVLMATCEKDWECISHLKIMFYVVLFRQRLIELEIVNLQIEKEMVGFQDGDIYPTVVIAFNNVQHFSKQKMNRFEPNKKDSKKQLAIKLDRLLVTMEQLLKSNLVDQDIDHIENNAKRLSLMIISINKIMVVLYDRN